MIEFKFNESKWLSLAGKITNKIQKGVDKSFRELKVRQIYEKEYLKSDLRIRSGLLAGSIRSQKQKNGLKISTDIDYARIQDVGGTLKNGGVIKPTYYWTNSINQLQKELRKSLINNIDKELRGIK